LAPSPPGKPSCCRLASIWASSLSQWDLISAFISSWKAPSFILFRQNPIYSNQSNPTFDTSCHVIA
jgi:hypothetical protein